MESAPTARLHDIINSSISAAFHQKMALAFWRHPSESIIHGILGSASVNETVIELETSDPGFILHPFDHIEEAGSWFIPADYHITLPLFGKIDISQDNEFYKKINSFLDDKKKDWFISKNLPCTMSDQQGRYLELVQDGVNAINEKRFDKVICARTRHIKLKNDFSIGLFFRSLIDAYPDAFISCVSHPRFGTWIGASPEILLEIDKNNQFRTIALAGTQPVNEPINPATAAWTQKEIQEQAMVSRFIINQFKKVRLREFVETGPQTTIAGNVMHLKTNYEVDLNEIDIEKLGTKMMRLLHPTSAVCGMPKLPAREFILREESFTRDLYSGFWGPINFHGLTSLNVNLRTMQLTKDEAIIYAGNGITHDSDPEKEWLETELKCETLLQLLS